MGRDLSGPYRPNHSISLAYVLVIRMIKIKVVSKFAYFCQQCGIDSKPLVTDDEKQGARKWCRVCLSRNQCNT